MNATVVTASRHGLISQVTFPLFRPTSERIGGSSVTTVEAPPSDVSERLSRGSVAQGPLASHPSTGSVAHGPLTVSISSSPSALTALTDNRDPRRATAATKQGVRPGCDRTADKTLPVELSVQKYLHKGNLPGPLREKTDGLQSKGEKDTCSCPRRGGKTSTTFEANR